MKEKWWNEPENKSLQADLQKVQSIGHPAEVFPRGISCPSDEVLLDVNAVEAGGAAGAPARAPLSVEVLERT